jgi:hypothetical protein
VQGELTVNTQMASSLFHFGGEKLKKNYGFKVFVGHEVQCFTADNNDQNFSRLESFVNRPNINSPRDLSSRIRLLY